MKPLFPSPRSAWAATGRAVAQGRSALVLIAASALWTVAGAQLPLTTQASTSGNSAVVQNEQVRAELVAHAPQGVQSGQPLWLGLQISHQPQWHTYWKNPGDSGLPTTLQWTLPTGVTAGEIDWPTPQLVKVGSMGNYGYGDTVLLPVPVTLAKSFTPGAAGELEVRLKAAWLVCRQECIPQEGNFVLHVPTRGSTAAHASAFAAAAQAAPKPLAGKAQAALADNALNLTVSGLPTAWQGKTLQAFAEAPNIADPSSAAQTQSWAAGVWSARLPLSPQREGTTKELPVVLALEGKSLRTVASVSGTWPALPDANASLASPAPAPASAAAPSGSSAPLPSGWSGWLVAMAAALLGGLILNLMPCVLPVLAIKVLGFSLHNGHSRAAHRAQGLAYTAGVLLSFMALGALMLALRATGEQLGWGFQLQSPAVLAALAVLFTLLGLNLAGGFEIGNLLPQGLATLQARHPTVDALLSGVLAVAIASPCTAPFMGASLGYAIALPAAQAMGIFAALGLGLALPFLLASWVPGVGRWLPKPGAWMDTLRRFMAFPMFATVVWLVWVLGHLSGVDGAASLLALLLSLAVVVWAAALRGRSRALVAGIAVAACAWLTFTLGPNVLRLEEPVSASAQTEGAAGSIPWQPWSPAQVDAALAQGHPVFVDFTAAWCITCQYNKKTTLSHADVVGDFRTHQVTLLRADWTRRDPLITHALEQLGRSGVPVYVLYRKDQEPIIFSEVLSKQDLRDALSHL